MMKGKLVAKKETSFVFKIEKIKKTWKGNKAADASKSIGKSITLSLSEVSSHHGGRIMSNYRKMKKGDQIELEAFDLEETNLCIKEWLKKVDESKEK